MISWLKYAPFDLRYSQSLGEVQGPQYLGVTECAVTMAGSTVSFDVPKHTAKVGDAAFYLRGQDCQSLIASSYNGMANDNWRYYSAFFRAWEYRKSWFRGVVGHSYMNVDLVFREKQHEFLDVSLLHPKGFEYALTLFLNARFGVGQPNLLHEHAGPINWQARDLPPVFAAAFQIKPNTMLFSFPVTEKCFVLVSFTHSLSQPELISEANAFYQKVVDSFKLVMPEEKTQGLNEIKADVAGWKVVETFPPLKWPITVEEVEGATVLESGATQRLTPES
ncbi:hypothetical protein SAMN02745866_01966 [Alteromonadaceae bacterium Bs31]|nr:hypothetical protein SAMN02745866_01966 [Alteromonadaceae bacterium Bs31]